jgi:hypothetical protein
LSGGAGTPAYAVVQHRDGTVTITIRQLVGVEGADARLAQLGVPVRTVALETGCATKRGEFTIVPMSSQLYERIRRVHGIAGAQEFTITPDAIPAGDTLLLAAHRIGHGLIAMETALYRGPAPPCLALRSSTGG